MEILPGVHRLSNGVSAVYLLADEVSGLTVIDTGPGPFERTILRYLKQIGRRPDEVQRILLTHRHFDHIGGAHGLRAATRARVYAHPLDAPQINGQERNRRPPGIMGAVMNTVLPLLFPFTPCPVDESLAADQILELGKLGQLQVIHTPGHTMGHCSFLLPSRRLLLLGDALGHLGGAVQVPPTFLNDNTALAQQTAIALRTCEVDALVFGHGAPILAQGQHHLEAAARKLESALVKTAATP